jgi:tyrosinase
MHNLVHTWMGGHFYLDGVEQNGTIADPEVSPNDPVFFVHHANLDRLWAEWEKLHPDNYADGPHGLGRDGLMEPFPKYNDERINAHGITPGSMLDTEQLGYTYE